MSLDSALETDGERPVDLPEVDAKPSWKVALKRASTKFSRDQCTDVAAMLTYYGLFSLFPALAAVVSLIGVFNVSPQTIIEVLADVTGKEPTDAAFDTPRNIITNFSEGSGAGLALIIGVLTALWSASGYVVGFSRAMNRIYNVAEGRPVWKLRPWLYLVTAIEAAMILIVLLAMALSGGLARSIGDQIGVGEQAVDVWNLAKWPFVALIVITIIGLLYWATPNVRKPRRMFFSWGAVVAFVVWILGTIAFAIYVSLSAGASYQKTYGAFAAAVLFLFWLWLTNVALLFGAELDAELERTRQLKSGLPAESLIMLPTRDDAGVEKQAAQLQSDIETAHELRVQSEGGTSDVERKDDVDSKGAATAAPAGVAALVDRTRGTSAPAKTSTPAASAAAGSSPQQQHANIEAQRAARRESALQDKAHGRKVRDRLAAQEKKAAEARRHAEQERKKAEKAAQQAISREERWASVEQTRAKFVPRQSAARDDVLRGREQRRSEFAGQRAAKSSAPAEPAEPQESPMPSERRLAMEQERAERRAAHFAANPPRPQEDIPLKFRRDRKRND